MFFLLACSDYELDHQAKGPDRDSAADSGRPGPGTGETGVDDTGGVDSGGWLEEEDYCTPFDDFSGWAYTGTGEWHVESGMLTEGRNGTYAAVAYAGDLGSANQFMIQVDTAWGPTANDLTGIAWAVSGDSAWVARWDDPQDYYDRHTPTGGMDISWCDSSGCTPFAADDTADLSWPEDLSFATWSVRVEGASVEVLVNGTVALRADVPEIEGTGPRVVGVYSNDNDGGVWFDNFCVWTSK